MFGTILGSRCVVMLLVLGLLWAGPAWAQTPEEPDTTDVEVTLEEPADPVNPPPFIVSLLDATELTPEQLEQMRTDGAGWGNIRIAALLAERIAADSEDATTWTAHVSVGNGERASVATDLSLPNHFVIAVEVQGDDVWIGTGHGLARGVGKGFFEGLSKTGPVARKEAPK